MINLCRSPVASLCATMMLDLHNAADADVTVWDASGEPPDTDSALSLCVDIQHSSNDKIKGWHQVGWIKQRGYAVVECEDPGLEHPHILFYDFLWNRSKAYYTQRTWDYRPWYFHNADNFLLQDTSRAEEKTCLFLSPTKPNTEFRKNLLNVTQRHSGYSNTTLHSNFTKPDATRVFDIIGDPQILGGYSPVHNAYYRETFFSVYTETIESGSTQMISEKTLDPLLKGHFILPFSCSGFVKYLKSRGWRLPTFINYSYDEIQDDQQRFRAFLQELNRLCSIDLDTWRQLWLDNVDIIEYNKSQLYNRPYHCLEVLTNGNPT